MKKTYRRVGRLIEGTILAALMLSVGMGGHPRQDRSGSGSLPLKVGDPAPDFTLPDQNNRPVRLSDFKGKKNVVLAFYVLAFTGG